MSEYYTHLLIPLTPEYRPEADAVVRFIQGIAENGNVASPSTISFSKVTKGNPPVREVKNGISGKTFNIPWTSRRIEKPQILASVTQIIQHAANQWEYDVEISGEGVPLVPPCAVGYVENGNWKSVVGPYSLEICCRVRSNVVRLSFVESENKWPPRFGEDCSAEERQGIFAHPEDGEIIIPNAGCGTFWIEFRYGKFIFPRLRHNGINVLDDSIVTLARKAFDCDFVQACEWG